ncbi:P-loop containing nucleoside triphosphate hydrolase protein [Trichodelitschia bisporula]|uniref:Signal recognition particle receptor subunit alpha homolog n=1 Tax=Trichodelitschia bisporula TaxID=703511 RepID=A0A6G1I879_9PEZI|nr:P-loop containing nucleoside triphosphate hydrolase protein [Trichodelitschia bisporula]
MLDSFEVLTTSGVVLWSRTYVPVGASAINALIQDIFIEERGTVGDAARPTYKRDGYTLKWRTAKDLGLIFVAVYQSLLSISWIDKLLDNVRALFTELYRDQLKVPRTTRVECPFDPYFDRQIKELEQEANNATTRSFTDSSAAEITPPGSEANELSAEEHPAVSGLRKAAKKPMYQDSTSTDVTPIATPDASRPNSPAHLLKAKAGPGGRVSRRSRKAAAVVTSSPAAASSGDESSANRRAAPKGGKKKMRKWDAEGLADEDDGVNLDYSAPAAEGERPVESLEGVDQGSWGTRTATGEFTLKDIGDEMDAILQSANAKDAKAADGSSGLVGSSLGAIGGLFRNVVGGKKLTREDLNKSLKGMEEHLLKKNVAREAAVRLCDSVEQDLIGMKTGSFTSVEATIRGAMERALRQILTPTSPLDLLREIQAVQGKRPYVISIVGVNGVGKSTNLSKICYFLLQNKYRVLIAAGDTFRSGAVEQLRVHTRNLRELTARQNAGEVDLYERGYGKDAATIARDAVTYAAQQGFDVVLIDTAGRRHNDQRLMSSLEKFAKMAQPDKILMVGEALVGSDAVQQARNFDAAFGAGRRLDGFIVSKCDTVGDMVGTLVSMVHATGIPVLFLGTGQHYSDLRTLRVESVVELLMRT